MAIAGFVLSVDNKEQPLTQQFYVFLCVIKDEDHCVPVEC